MLHHRRALGVSDRHEPSCSICGPSRREFLATAVALGGTAALAAPTARAQTPVATGPKLIDVHHHIVPPFWFEEVKERISAQGGGRILQLSSMGG